MKTATITGIVFALGWIFADACIAQTGQVNLNASYSDWNAPANITGTYTDQSPGSYAVVTNAATSIIHARIGWPSPGLTNYVPVSVLNPDGTTASLANYYSWQVWPPTPSAIPNVVIISYPFQPGQTTFMVSGVVPPPPPPGTVSLSWSPPSVIKGYRLSYGFTDGGPYVNSIDVGMSTSATLTNLPSGQTIYAVTQSYDASGNLSCPSNQIQATVP